MSALSATINTDTDTNRPVLVFPDYEALKGNTQFDERYIDLIANITAAPDCTNDHHAAIAYLINRYHKNNPPPPSKGRAPAVPYGGEIAKSGLYTKFNIEMLPKPLCAIIYAYLSKAFVLE